LGCAGRGQAAGRTAETQGKTANVRGLVLKRAHGARQRCPLVYFMFGEARCFGKTSAELIFELWREIGIPAPGIEVVGPHSALEVTFAARRALHVADEAWDSHGVRKALSGPKLLSDEVNRPPRVLNFVPAISYAICVLGPRILHVTCVEGIASRA